MIDTSKICLIRPPAVESFRFATTSITPPLGLSYIASALESAGDGGVIKIIDAVGIAPDTRISYFKGYLVGLSSQDIVKDIPSTISIVGITVVFTHEWPAIVDLIKRIKVDRPDIVVILGGEHVTAMSEFSLKTSDSDIIVTGEGEETIVELVQKLQRGSDISNMVGIVFKKNQQIIVNPRRERRSDVDSIVWPAWHLFDLETYQKHRFVGGMHSDHLTVPILATRGCPYQCTYCSSPGMWSPRWIPRDPIKVVDEIEYYINHYGARNFPFQDLTAILKKKWIIAFCKEVISRKLDITWLLPTGTRSESIDVEVAKLLKESGMVSMAYAPESGSELTRKLVKKKMKTVSLFDSIDAAIDGGLNVAIFLVIGFPHDNKESLVENLPFIDKLASSGVQDVSVGYYMALPGTELFYSLYDSGKICLDINYFRHILDSLAILPSQSYTSSLGRLDLMLWKLRMFKRFYTANRIGLNKKPLLVRVLDLLSGLGKKKHETRLQTAIRNGLESALTTFIVKFKPAWLNSKQEELMFTNWDKIYRELRLKKISQLAAKPYPEDTTELHKTNVINLLKVEHNVKYKV